MLHVMSKSPTLGTWPNDPPKGHDLMAQIRNIAQDSGRVYFSQHAEGRLLSRGYNDLDVIRGFRIGDIEGAVIPGDHQNEWVCEVIFPANEERGSRNIGTITIVMDGSRLLIKTVMWKDKR